MEKSHTVQKDFVVNIEYILRLDNGKLVEQSEDGKPLAYLHGHGTIIPGLEEALTGKLTGETCTVTLPPEKAYGERLEDAVEWLPRAIFPPHVALESGTALQIEDGEGGIMTMYIHEVEKNRVLVDHNHPLAGETLNFSVKVVGVRPAKPEELAHGHVHDQDGEHHHTA